jgi:hypothetical protein
MMTNGSRRAACAVALALAACTPERAHVAATTDAGHVDAARDRASGGARETHADVRAEVHADVPAAPEVDAGPPCVVGGTSELLPVTVGCASSPLGRLAIAGDHVYWTVRGSGAVVVRAPLAGGAPEALVYDGAAALGLAVDATFVYYTQPAVGRVMRVPVGGGLPVALAKGLDDPSFLAIESPSAAGDGPTDGGGVASLYWTGGQVRGAGTVMKLALSSGATPVLLIDGQTHPYAIAVQDAFVYWTDLDDGTILRTAAAGPGDGGVRTASRLAAGLTGPADLVLAGGFAFAPDQTGHIQRVPLAGGALEPIIDVSGIPAGVATDGVSIYWSTFGNDGGIFTAPLSPSAAASTKDGGVPSLVPTPQPDPFAIAVSATDIYWTTLGGHPSIRRFAK